MNRREVLSICCKARTRAEIKAAWDARARYLAARPDDYGVVEVGETLCMSEEALDLLGRDHEEAPFPVVQEEEPMPV